MRALADNIGFRSFFDVGLTFPPTLSAEWAWTAHLTARFPSPVVSSSATGDDPNEEDVARDDERRQIVPLATSHLSTPPARLARPGLAYL